MLIFAAMKRMLFLLLLLFSGNLIGQNCFSFEVRDSASNETLPGASILLLSSGKGVQAGAGGTGRICGIPGGQQSFRISLTGYKTQVLPVFFPQADSGKQVTIRLVSDAQDIEEVVVSSSRTNSRIDDLPTKVEVLGQEDMDEENGIKPGNVGSLLGDLSVIHIQQVSAITGGSVVRMQGLDGRYTQLLRDGLPLYDGFSGNLGILQIPPLDLKQAEIVKGPASVLYGGGAISGMINLISREPSDSSQLSLTLNESTLRETNLNIFGSKRKDKIGFTCFAGGSMQAPVDVNSDGFSDVAKSNSAVLHPRVFFYPGKKTTADLGWSMLYEERMGGDMNVIALHSDTLHRFFQQNRSTRNTFDGHFSHDFSDKVTLLAKSAWTLLDRTYTQPGFLFGGTLLTGYNEVALRISGKTNTLVAGANAVLNDFERGAPDSLHLGSLRQYTLGGFVTDQWKIGEKITAEPGIRFDHHDTYGSFVLPALNLLYKPGTHFSLRVGGGMGYKTPDAFEYTSSEDLPYLQPVSKNMKAETSTGLNTDIMYRISWPAGISLQVDQALYYTQIDHVIGLRDTSYRYLVNTGQTVNAIGTDTYMRLTIEDLEIYLGYNHTRSVTDSAGVEQPLAFSPNDKFSTTIAYEIEGQWRFGLESSLAANQYDRQGNRLRSYWFGAAMIERKFGTKASLVLNCENLLDARQSRYETLFTGTITQPVFKSLYMPIDGRVINLSLRVKL